MDTLHITKGRERDMTTDDDEYEDLGTTLPRRQLGKLLNEARTEAGLTLEDACRVMGWKSKTTLSNIERGKTDRLRMPDMNALIELYNVDSEKASAIRELAKIEPTRSWLRSYEDIMTAKFNLYAGLESAATELAIYQPLVIPGLLQTKDYATALDMLYYPDAQEVSRRVELRMQRQHLITRPREPLALQVVLTEGALRTVVGGPSVMNGQCRHLADIGTRDNISIRLLPFSEGFPTGESLPSFIVMEFGRDARGNPEGPPLVYAESSVGGDAYLETREDVRRCRQAFRRLWSASLDDRSSRAKLRDLAREYQ